MSAGAYLPPLTDSVCPVTYDAISDTRNTTAFAMSSGCPKRLRGMLSTSRCWRSSPIACHCASESGFERTSPGATLFTVMPCGPS